MMLEHHAGSGIRYDKPKFCVRYFPNREGKKTIRNLKKVPASEPNPPRLRLNCRCRCAASEARGIGLRGKLGFQSLGFQTIGFQTLRFDLSGQA